MPSFLSIKNFGKYQHYTKRNPPWIKLYYEILDDCAFISMSITSRHHYMTLLMIAGRQNNAIINEGKYLQKVMRLDDEPDLSELIAKGFLIASGRQSASKTLATRYQNALSETETKTETKAETKSTPGEFEQFWEAYPRKEGGKKAAHKAFEKAKDRPDISAILSSIQRAAKSEQWIRENGKYIPYPATWLNQGRWQDVPMTVLPGSLRPTKVVL